MFQFLKNDILRIMDETQSECDAAPDMRRTNARTVVRRQETRGDERNASLQRVFARTTKALGI